MAAVDDRLDREDLALPHTNGYVNGNGNGSTTSPPSQEQLQQPNELDYKNIVDTVNATSTEPTSEERIPAISTDVDQPQGLEEPDVPQQQQQPTLVSSSSVFEEGKGEGVVSQSESLGEAILPAPGQDNSVPLEQVEPELPSISSTTAQTQATEPSFTPSLDSLPDAPAPLPSQLVNETAPSLTDATQGVVEQLSNDNTTTTSDAQPTASLSALLDSSAPTPTAPTSFEPSTVTMETEDGVPPSSAPVSAVSPFPAHSPSLAKRPFEPDTSSTDASYFGADAQAVAAGGSSAVIEGQEEPSLKRQKISPIGSPSAIPAEAAAGAEAGADAPVMQIDEASAPTSTAPVSAAPAPATAEAEADGQDADADGDVDAADAEEADSSAPPAAASRPELDASMIDQSLDFSLVRISSNGRNCTRR